ncbi:DsbA family protein [Scandinavium sp.]|uniref:DsbA family protein n=1 Tax=Scandinavium sp. TaxID=2830653 RepID=UPI00289EB870|nr:DsbA family protein [Scandinavium sp.]
MITHYACSVKESWIFKNGMSALMLFALFSFDANSTIKEGEQYSVLQQPVAQAPDVIEFFSFYCGPCYQFTQRYPVSEGINRVLPADKMVTKYHVSAIGKLGNELTEAWAIAMVMGKSDAIEKPLFEAVQKTKNLRKASDIKAIFSHAGVTPAEYESAQNSLVVKALIAKQEAALQQFSVSGTPSYYVNGRYKINNSGINADTPEGYVTGFAGVVSYLLEL